MNALLVFFVLPILIGVACQQLVRAMRAASLAAAIAAPAAVVFCIMASDPDDAWNWIAALLVSPLVVAIAVVTVMLCCRHPHARKRGALNGG